MKLEILFVDGSIETVEEVDKMIVRDDILRLYQQEYNSPISPLRHMASYPIANLKRWRRV